jgi:CheY-like chemotaxis protein/Tfp pilus assembly protein PilZ
VVAQTEDVSARGLFIRTEDMLPIGAETAIVMELPDGTSLHLRGRVAHTLTPAAARALGRHPGMGFELTGPDTPDRLLLRAHIDSLQSEITSPGLSTTTQVVVVDPSPPMRTRIAGALGSAGFRVTALATATEALTACASWRPDAVVAATQMDGMTGIDLAYAMSEHVILADVPLVLTGDDGDLGRLHAFRAGVRDHIPRPFLDEELVIRVHRVVTPPAPGTSFGLRGSLVDIGLGTLLSLFEFERKSGVLLLLRGGEIARVFVADGRILEVEAHAEASAARERLMHLLDWRDGQFEFTPVEVQGRDKLGMSITALLLEHARIRDEQNAQRG